MEKQKNTQRNNPGKNAGFQECCDAGRQEDPVFQVVDQLVSTLPDVEKIGGIIEKGCGIDWDKVLADKKVKDVVLTDDEFEIIKKTAEQFLADAREDGNAPEGIENADDLPAKESILNVLSAFAYTCMIQTVETAFKTGLSFGMAQAAQIYREAAEGIPAENLMNADLGQGDPADQEEASE